MGCHIAPHCTTHSHASHDIAPRHATPLHTTTPLHVPTPRRITPYHHPSALEATQICRLLSAKLPSLFVGSGLECISATLFLSSRHFPPTTTASAVNIANLDGPGGPSPSSSNLNSEGDSLGDDMDGGGGGGGGDSGGAGEGHGDRFWSTNTNVDANNVWGDAPTSASGSADVRWWWRNPLKAGQRPGEAGLGPHGYEGGLAAGGHQVPTDLADGLYWERSSMPPATDVVLLPIVLGDGVGEAGGVSVRMGNETRTYTFGSGVGNGEGEVVAVLECSFVAAKELQAQWQGQEQGQGQEHGQAQGQGEWRPSGEGGPTYTHSTDPGHPFSTDDVSVLSADSPTHRHSAAPPRTTTAPPTYLEAAATVSSVVTSLAPPVTGALSREIQRIRFERATEEAERSRHLTVTSLFSEVQAAKAEAQKHRDEKTDALTEAQTNVVRAEVVAEAVRARVEAESEVETLRSQLREIQLQLNSHILSDLVEDDEKEKQHQQLHAVSEGRVGGWEGGAELNAARG